MSRSSTGRTPDFDSGGSWFKSTRLRRKANFDCRLPNCNEVPFQFVNRKSAIGIPDTRVAQWWSERLLIARLVVQVHPWVLIRKSFALVLLTGQAVAPSRRRCGFESRREQCVGICDLRFAIGRMSLLAFPIANRKSAIANPQSLPSSNGKDVRPSTGE